MHRLLGGGVDVWDPVNCRWRATDVVDHKDRDTLNNSRSNLRVCDHSQNLQNSVGKPYQRKSKFKGVTYCRDRNKPRRTSIKAEGRQMCGGYFKSEKEAATRYHELAKSYFGEFARLNDV
jgi:hypothetical protein